MFGCSVPANQTEEGCGEARIYLKCDDTNKSIDLENKTTENWKGQGHQKFPNQKNVRLNHTSTSSQLLST